MPENKPRRLNEVLSPFAPEGANDRKWFLIEHQLEQVKVSANTALSTLLEITSNPENENERKVADACYLILRGMRVEILADHAAFLSYLSGTDVPDRTSRKEL